MIVRGIVWVGVDTPNFEDMVRFARDTLGLRAIYEGEFAGADTVEFECPNGTRLQVTRGSAISPPWPLFEVDDLVRARQEVEAAGVEILGPDESDGVWSWFGLRAPDGNTYSLGAKLDIRVSGHAEPPARLQ